MDYQENTDTLPTAQAFSAASKAQEEAWAALEEQWGDEPPEEDEGECPAASNSASDRKPPCGGEPPEPEVSPPGTEPATNLGPTSAPVIGIENQVDEVAAPPAAAPPPVVKKGKPSATDHRLDALEKSGKWLSDGDNHYFLRGDEPVRVGSDAWRHFVGEQFSLGPTSRATKALTEAAEGAALNHGIRMGVDLLISHEDNLVRVALGHGDAVAVGEAEGPGLQFPRALSADRAVVLPPEFEPMTKRQLLRAEGQARADGINVRRMPSFRRQILDRLQPSAPGSLDGAEVAAIVFAMWISMFIAPLVRARPIGCFYGPPGSGKTVLGRILGLLFCGAKFEVTGGMAGSRTTKDFLATWIDRSLVVRDDLNNAGPDLVDVLCRVATGAEVSISKLYETLALASFQSRAFVIITAYKPKWVSRADLLSRFIVLRLDRPEPAAETDAQREARVLTARPAIWLETLTVLHEALRQPWHGTCATRFVDWERYVMAAATVVGLADPLASALNKMSRERVAMAASTDPFLALLWMFSAQPGMSDAWFTAADLVNALMDFSGAQAAHKDPMTAGATVRSPQSLGKMLRHLHDEGSAVIDVQFKGCHDNKLRWRIQPRGL